MPTHKFKVGDVIRHTYTPEFSDAPIVTEGTIIELGKIDNHYYIRPINDVTNHYGLPTNYDGTCYLFSGKWMELISEASPPQPYAHVISKIKQLDDKWKAKQAAKARSSSTAPARDAEAETTSHNTLMGMDGVSGVDILNRGSTQSEIYRTYSMNSPRSYSWITYLQEDCLYQRTALQSSPRRSSLGSSNTESQMTRQEALEQAGRNLNEWLTSRSTQERRQLVGLVGTSQEQGRNG